MAQSLLLGAAREDITPNIGARIFGYSPTQYSERIRDRLSVTALAFGCGEKKSMLITATVGEIATALTNQLRAEISERTGISTDAIIIAATHTHSGPTLVDMIGWGDIDYEYY